jgi:hypothetical protein
MSATMMSSRVGPISAVSRDILFSCHHRAGAAHAVTR